VRTVHYFAQYQNRAGQWRDITSRRFGSQPEADEIRRRFVQCSYAYATRIVRRTTIDDVVELRTRTAEPRQTDRATVRHESAGYAVGNPDRGVPSISQDIPPEVLNA
jgi:hypothetical protein